MRISDWSSDVCSSDLAQGQVEHPDDARINRSRMLDFEGRGDTIARPLQPQYINKTDGIGTGRSGNRLRQALKASLTKTHPIMETPAVVGCDRSEERRVGKECVSQCRSRWLPYS